MSIDRRSALVMMLIAGLMVASPSAAQGLPRYDPVAYCKQVAEVVGGAASIYNGCIDMEQEAYNWLKANWSALPAKVTNYCDSVARTVGGTYQIFKGCVDMETDALADTPTFKF